MTEKERKLFQVGLLEKGLFPKLDKRGRIACQHEIQTWGFRQFLEDGWNSLCSNDETLENWIGKLISIEVRSKPPVVAERISRSIRYGATIVFYPLQIQVEESSGEYVMPKTSREQEGSLSSDLGEEDAQALGNFLSEFDKSLASVINGFLSNPIFLQHLQINESAAYLGAYLTYFALANKSESLGMEKKFKVSE